MGKGRQFANELLEEEKEGVASWSNTENLLLWGREPRRAQTRALRRRTRQLHMGSVPDSSLGGELHAILFSFSGPSVQKMTYYYLRAFSPRRGRGRNCRRKKRLGLRAPAMPRIRASICLARCTALHAGSAVVALTLVNIAMAPL